MSVKQIQEILVFQQNGSGEGKIAGIRKHGGRSLALKIISNHRHHCPLTG
jgi:hypothetical protein